MKQYQNQTFDQKKGSADRDVTGSKKGMPGGDIGRGSMSSSSSSSTSASNQSRSAGSKADHGGPEGNSRERKTSRSGSHSNES